MKYVKGDVTNPQTTNPCIIPHIVNDIGAWGSGVVMAISKRWPEPAEQYSRDCEFGLRLGDIGVCCVSDGPEIHVANMVAQKGIGTGASFTVGQHFYHLPPIRYDALAEAMIRVGNLAGRYKCEIHAPKFGSDRAGGDWNKIEELIREIWENNGISVTIYEYEGV